MRPSAGTPYLARVPETQIGSPHAPENREPAIARVAPARCISLLGDGLSNPADRTTAERPMLACELNGVFFLAAESSETSIRC